MFEGKISNSEKIIENVISRKLKGFEHQHEKTEVATNESTLTATHYIVENFKLM